MYYVEDIFLIYESHGFRELTKYVEIPTQYLNDYNYHLRNIETDELIIVDGNKFSVMFEEVLYCTVKKYKYYICMLSKDAYNVIKDVKFEPVEPLPFILEFDNCGFLFDTLHNTKKNLYGIMLNDSFNKKTLILSIKSSYKVLYFRIVTSNNKEFLARYAKFALVGEY